VASYVSRDEDVRLVKELVSRIIPRRKLGYMKKKNVYRAGVSSGLQS
jgi:hypothetical protein